MAVGDVFSLAIDQSLHGVLLTNVFHYEQTGAGAGLDEQELIDAWQADVATDWSAAISDQLIFTCARARQVSGSGAFPEHFEIITGGTGSLVGEAFPANAVAVISFYSETYTKAGRGRMFVSGCRMSDEDENCWEQAQFALLDTMASTIIDEITDPGSGADFKLVIWGGSPATKKTVVKKEVRPQVRKLRGRSTKSCIAATPPP